MVQSGNNITVHKFQNESDDFGDWQVPLAFTQKRHLEKIVAAELAQQTWRMKERVGISRVYVKYIVRVNLITSHRTWFLNCTLKCKWWLEPLNMTCL